MFNLARPITPDEIRTFDIDGVVLLRGLLDLRSINHLRRCIDEAVATLGSSGMGYDFTALADAFVANDDATIAASDGRQHDVSGVVRHMRASGKPLLHDEIGARPNGHFFIDSAVAARIRELRKFIRHGAAPEIAGMLLGGEEVRFFGDQIFVKEPGTRERTAFHQDATYFDIDGDKCCVLWIPVDPVAAETGGMLYVRGSHKDRKLYKPNVFVSQTPLPASEGEALPDIEANLDDYDVVSFDVEPGDVIVHHYRTIHGARGNLSRYQVRRAISIRYTGDDIRGVSRPWTPKQLHLTRPIEDGQPLGDPDFPVVWRKRSHEKAA